MFKSVTEATDKPVVAFGRSTYSCLDESRAYQEEAGMPFLQAIKPTLRALAGLGLYGERKQLGSPEAGAPQRIARDQGAGSVGTAARQTAGKSSTATCGKTRFCSWLTRISPWL